MANKVPCLLGISRGLRRSKIAIKIVTDSGADIPIELVKRLGITVVPLTLSFGEQTYLDGVELSPDEFYEKLIDEEIMPTTSQPSVGSFIEVYKKLNESSKIPNKTLL